MKRLKRREADKRLHMREKQRVRNRAEHTDEHYAPVRYSQSAGSIIRYWLRRSRRGRATNRWSKTYIYSSICSDACVCVCVCMYEQEREREREREQMREESWRLQRVSGRCRPSDVGVRVARARRTGEWRERHGVERERKRAAARATAMEWHLRLRSGGRVVRVALQEPHDTRVRLGALDEFLCTHIRVRTRTCIFN